MGANVPNNQNINSNNLNEEIIEYQGYEEFAIEKINNIPSKQENTNEKNAIEINIDNNNEANIYYIQYLYCFHYCYLYLIYFLLFVHYLQDIFLLFFSISVP